MILSSLRPHFLLLLLAGGLVMSAAQAQDGKFNLDPLVGSLEPKVNINFGPAMMAGFAESMTNSNPDLSSLLAGIQGLRLMVFEDLSDTRELASEIAASIDELVDQGWNLAVQVKEDNEQIDLFILESGQLVTGIVLMVRESSDTAVLANIHGEMNPVLVGRLVASGKLFEGFDFGAMIERAASD